MAYLVIHANRARRSEERGKHVHTPFKWVPEYGRGVDNPALDRAKTTADFEFNLSQS